MEIGGDVNSTDGSEPSHAANRDEFEHPKPEYFRRGYEWWLMEEARKRNPHIILESLQWGAPGWIGNGNFASQDNARFIAAFHKGAKQYHNLDIEYQGIWNEKRCDPEWIKVLRKTLDQSGLRRVKIVADDEWQPEHQWRIAERMAKDPALCAAVHTLNAHVAEVVNFYVPKFAGSLNKPLWNGEAHAYGGDWYAAAGHARYNNRAYIQGRITKTVSWSLISSYHDYLPFPKSGMMKANTPWSGRYEVQPPLWMIAHTNQFAEPGWKYLDSACKLFANEACLREGWSIVALRSPDSGDYSIIIETMDAKLPQNVRFQRLQGPVAGRSGRVAVGVPGRPFRPPGRHPRPRRPVHDDLGPQCRLLADDDPRAAERRARPRHAGGQAVSAAVLRRLRGPGRRRAGQVLLRSARHVRRGPAPRRQGQVPAADRDPAGHPVGEVSQSADHRGRSRSGRITRWRWT